MISESDEEVRQQCDSFERAVYEQRIANLADELRRLREANRVTAVNFGKAQLEIAKLQTMLARVEALAARYESVPHDACATSSVAKYIRAALRDDPQPSAAPTPKGEPYNGY